MSPSAYNGSPYTSPSRTGEVHTAWAGTSWGAATAPLWPSSAWYSGQSPAAAAATEVVDAVRAATARAGTNRSRGTHRRTPRSLQVARRAPGAAAPVGRRGRSDAARAMLPGPRTAEEAP